MLTEAAIKSGLEVTVVDPTPNCPARQVGAEQIIGSYKDKKALMELASKSDYLTIEIEHIDTEVLAEVASAIPVSPQPATIKMIQNKYDQKKFLKKNDFKTADFLEVNSAEEAGKVFDRWGGRMLLKSKKNAYDGRGNMLIAGRSQIASAVDKLGKQGVYGEEIVNFQKELAVMVAKDIRGNVLAYPVVETVHTRNICTEVYAPAQISAGVAAKAEKTAKYLVTKLDGAGVYGVELFLDEKDDILVNEIAPRVHNSGHYTMDLCDISQFEQHIRVVTGQPVRQISPLSKACCMINILGERNGPVELDGVAEAEKIPGVSVYIYGKAPTGIDRKMGHINAIGDTIEEAKTKARKARKLISI